MHKISELIKLCSQSFCRMLGVQIVPLTVQQRELLKENPLLRYRHFVAQEVILMQSGQINLEESKFLGQLITNLKTEGPIVEIGTLFGWSTRIICLFKEDLRELISVDNFSWNPFNLPPDMHFQITKQVLLDEISRGHLKLLKMSNVEFYNTYSGPPPAFFFIDADHDYEAVSIDIQGAFKLNANVICGHDYDKNKSPGVVKAVDEFGGPTKLVGSLWVL